MALKFHPDKNLDNPEAEDIVSPSSCALECRNRTMILFMRTPLIRILGTGPHSSEQVVLGKPIMSSQRAVVSCTLLPPKQGNGLAFVRPLFMGGGIAVNNVVFSLKRSTMHMRYSLTRTRRRSMTRME